MIVSQIKKMCGSWEFCDAHNVWILRNQWKTKFEKICDFFFMAGKQCACSHGFIGSYTGLPMSVDIGNKQ